MKFTKSQITKAGKTLLTSKTIEERNKALEIINEWRTDHLYALNVMRNALVRVLEKNKISVT